MSNIKHLLERMRALTVTTADAPLTFDTLSELAHLVIRLASKGNEKLVLDHLFGCVVHFRHGMTSPLRRGVFIVRGELGVDYLRLELLTQHTESRVFYKTYSLFRFKQTSDIVVGKEDVLLVLSCAHLFPVIDRIVSPSGEHQDVEQGQDIDFVGCSRCNESGRYALNMTQPCPGCDGEGRHPRAWDPNRRRTVRDCLDCSREVLDGPTRCVRCILVDER